MAAAGGGPAPGLTGGGALAALRAEPYLFDFFQAVRLLERAHPDRAPVGRDAHPSRELVRFRPPLTLAFPASAVVGYEPPDESRPVPLMTVAFLGLYGPSGVLPTHYTQMLLDLVRDVRGPERRALRDWLDLFNHRMTSLYYRAWEKYRFPIAYERGDAHRAEPDTFTTALTSLIGFGPRSHRDRLRVDAAPAPGPRPGASWLDDTPPAAKPLAAIDDLALLYYAGFFVQRPRNAANLRALVADYFRLPAAVEPFRGQWLALAPGQQTCLGLTGALGVSAVVGSKVWDVQSRFRLRLGPLTYAQFEEFLPDPRPTAARKSFYLLAQLVRVFVGSEYDFDVQLALAAGEVPEAHLSQPHEAAAGPRLGWNLWLVSAPPAPAAPDAPDADDAAFEADWVTAATPDSP